jgi:hypothetical protein
VTRLLHDVSELVCDQVPASHGRGLELTRSEDNVPAIGVGERVECVRRFACRSISVYANFAEVAPEFRRPLKLKIHSNVRKLHG